MKKIAEPGDVSIKRFEIENENIGAIFNPMDQLIGFDIWEDITKPTMYATFVFDDAINLLETFPIIGEETVHVEFVTPGMNKSTYLKFRCFEVTNVQKSINNKSVQYTMRCVSEEHLFNGSNMIVQSYTDIISNIVPNILSSYLMTSKEIIIDDTKGLQTISFPRLNPLQAIDMCRQRAVSSRFPSSSYVFFENQAGFNFKTIEGLLDDSKQNVGSRIFNASENPMASKEEEAKSFRTLLDYQNIARSDSNAKAMQGAFKAVTQTFDLLTKKFEKADFNLKEKFASFETPADNKAIPNTEGFINKFGEGSPKHFFIPKDTSRPDNFIDTMVAVRNAFSVLLNSDITRAMIHGDSGLKVGDVVELRLPQSTGLTKKPTQDKLVAGNYLIIRLRHMITPSTKSKHQIVFDCVKMGI